ncbi:hypothetical protein [Streptomyces sp. NPDC085937]
MINGERIPLEYNGLLFDGDTFAQLLLDIHRNPEQWKRTVLDPPAQ